MFFFAVYIIGVPALRKFEKLENINKAIKYSIIGWVTSLFIYGSTFSYFSYNLEWRQIPIFFILIGILIGFNIGAFIEIKRK